MERSSKMQTALQFINTLTFLALVACLALWLFGFVEPEVRLGGYVSSDVSGSIDTDASVEFESYGNSLDVDVSGELYNY